MVVKGTSASNGYGIGKIFLFHKKESSFSHNEIIDVAKEIDRLETAIAASVEQLKTIKNKITKEVDSEKDAVFETHIALLEDIEFVNNVLNFIKINFTSCEKALLETNKHYLNIFEHLEDEHLKEMAYDIEDVINRILNNLQNKKSTNFSEEIYDDTVLVAHMIPPSEIAMLDKHKIKAILTEVGGSSSHSAIIARTLGIPYVCGLKNITSLVKNGDSVLVDGEKGVVLINESKRDVSEYFKRRVKS